MKRLIAMLLVLVFLLTACSGNQDNDVTNSGNSNETSEVSQPDDSQPDDSSASENVAENDNNELVEYFFQKANDVVVTDTDVTFFDDGSGTYVTIKKNPQNASVLYGSLACLWYEAGGTIPLIVGGKSSTAMYISQLGRDVTQDEGVTVIVDTPTGTNWDVESILAAQPDLIVTSVGLKGYETISGPAQAVGIPVIGIDYDGVQDYLKWFKVFCNLNGHPELWDEAAVVTGQKIIDTVSKVPEDVDAPRAVILTVASGKLVAYTHASQPGVIFADLGGINLVDEDGTSSAANIDINLEEIYALDPDMIFVSERLAEPGATMEQLLEMVGEDPVWQSLDAVKEGKIYSLERSLYFEKANKRYDESYTIMAQYMYPDCEF